MVIYSNSRKAENERAVSLYRRPGFEPLAYAQMVKELQDK